MKRITLGKIVSDRLLACDKSPDYFLLIRIFRQTKEELLARYCTSPCLTSASPALRLLQRKFSEAIVRLRHEKTEFSYFAVDNLEKLLTIQYKYEEEARITNWLHKMDNLDFCNRTRLFISELRKKHNVHRKAGPLIGPSGAFSKNFDETLDNWAEYYMKLYFCTDPQISLPTPDLDPVLDRENFLNF